MATYIDKDGITLTMSQERKLTMGQVEANAQAMVLCDLLGVYPDKGKEAVDKLLKEDPKRLRELDKQAQETVAEYWEQILEALAESGAHQGMELVPIEEIMAEEGYEGLTSEEAEALYLERLAQTWQEFKEENLSHPEW